MSEKLRSCTTVPGGSLRFVAVATVVQTLFTSVLSICLGLLTEFLYDVAKEFFRRRRRRATKKRQKALGHHRMVPDVNDQTKLAENLDSENTASGESDICNPQTVAQSKPTSIADGVPPPSPPHAQARARQD